MSWIQHEADMISHVEMMKYIHLFAEKARQNICKDPRRVLLLPPDITRAHSGAGWITEELYRIFSLEAEVHVIPTLGQHVPHTTEQNRRMFGTIPEERIHIHDWRNGTVAIGEIPSMFVRVISEGKANWPIPIFINRMLWEGDWDLILNIGHVVPHEVLGFANHNKNYFIGLGGKPTICASHMMAACCGIENNLGSLMTPLRTCFNKAENEFLARLPDAYFEVVMSYDNATRLVHSGIFAGDDISVYVQAAACSSRRNITIVPPLKKIVAYMQEDEFFSTWVANKAIYRTRKAIADGGELLILAPGLKRFGEQDDVDSIIRRYGYRGASNIIKLWHSASSAVELRELAHTAAHLIHGSSDGRFSITYAPGHLTENDIRSVNFSYADIGAMLERYNPENMRQGFNTMADGEKIYFIATPSAGLWSTSERLHRNTFGG